MTTSSPGPLLKDPLSGLSYRLLLPAPAAPQRALVLLHGVGSNELSMLEVGNISDERTLVVLVQGPLFMGPSQHAWFQVEFTNHGPRIVPEEAENSRQALINFLGAMQRSHGIAPSNTTLAGFSQGGIMSAGVALTSPETVGSFGILAGRILPEIGPRIASAERLEHLQGFVGHGEMDDRLPVDWAQRSHEWLDKMGVSHRYSLYPVGHTVGPQMHQDFVQWWKGLGVQLNPERS